MISLIQATNILMTFPATENHNDIDLFMPAFVLARADEDQPLPETFQW